MGQMRIPLKEVTIRDLFFGSEKNIYEIPIYQRNYAWGKDEISALISDVYDEYKKNAGKPYYIGTLVSYPKGDNTYEVIDGQQRLTTIRIILSALNKEKPTNRLTYRARKKSDYTIKNLPKFVKDEEHEVDEGIENGFKYARTELNELGIMNDDSFIGFFLDKVHIIHYKVPKDIDLNHYFEIMNSRGEQLEKHEIEKAALMDKLDVNEHEVFNGIWESCSNMGVYVQQSFEGIESEKVFGDDLHSFRKIISFSKLVNLYSKEREEKEKDNTAEPQISIKDIIDQSTEWNDVKKTEGKDSFQPIIDFPNFLLIVLKITRMDDPDFKPDGFSLDDKELLNEFEKANMDKERVSKFAFNLLKAKYLLDNYVVHQSKEENSEEKNPWKLQVWHKEGKQKQAHSYPKDLVDDKTQEDKKRETQDVLVQLLAMFEVSFTARQRKNYLFYCLLYLMNQDISNISIPEYRDFVEGLANKFFKRVYLDGSRLNEINTPYPGSFDECILKGNKLDESEDLKDSEKDLKKFIGIYGDGTERSKGIPLFVFNYLDYLLWRKYNKELQGRKTKKHDRVRQEFFGCLGCSDFELNIFDQFYFSRTRRSLEHYYPQHQATGEGGRPTPEQINCFGNFAMIGSEANSSGSDWLPKTKNTHYLDASGKIKQISVASLKFWIMMQMCKDKGQWEFSEIKNHQDKMLAILLD